MNEIIELKINFSDFWPGFDKRNNFFYNLLIEKYKVIITDQPDILFYSVYGPDHIKFNCTKVLYTGENIRPDFVLCDFAFSYDYSNSKRNFRLPLYALYGDVATLIKRKINAEEILKSKKKFCCFIVSNDACLPRNEFFIKLSKYKQIDSGGKLFNNIGGPVKNKLEFIRNYKFVIAFENTSYPGYTTEKVFEPLMEDCLPIYWGDPKVGNDFNTKRFINCHEFPSFDDAINRIIETDNDDELFMKYISEPIFNNDELNQYVRRENIKQQLDNVVSFHFNGKLKLLPKIRPAYFAIKGIVEKSGLVLVTASRRARALLKKIYSRKTKLVGDK